MLGLAGLVGARHGPALPLHGSCACMTCWQAHPGLTLAAKRGWYLRSAPARHLLCCPGCAAQVQAQRLRLATPPAPQLCADQHRELPEYLDYYRRLGVSHVYAMEDPQSEPPLAEVLRPFVQASALSPPARACVRLCAARVCRQAPAGRSPPCPAHPWCRSPS